MNNIGSGADGNIVRRVSKTLKNIMSISEVGIFIIFIVLVVIITVIKPQFIGIKNIQAIVRGLSFLGIVVIGETLVLLTGDFDISVGSVAGFGAIMATWIMSSIPAIGTPMGIILALTAAAGLGLVNGLLIVKLRIPAFITTIGMMYIAKGFSMIITKGYPFYPLTKTMNKIGSIEPFGTSLTFVLFIVLAVIAEFVLRKTKYGRYLYATGGNREVAKLAGINTTYIRLSAFVIVSFLAGVAGILQAATLQTGTPLIGDGWELRVIAATAIGGVSLMGGIGSVFGAVVGLFILGVLNNGLVILGINTFWQNVVTGVAMILALYIDIARRSTKLNA